MEAAPIEGDKMSGALRSVALSRDRCHLRLAATDRRGRCRGRRRRHHGAISREAARHPAYMIAQARALLELLRPTQHSADRQRSRRCRARCRWPTVRKAWARRHAAWPGAAAARSRRQDRRRLGAYGKRISRALDWAWRSIISGSAPPFVTSTNWSPRPACSGSTGWTRLRRATLPAEWWRDRRHRQSTMPCR